MGAVTEPRPIGSGIRTQRFVDQIESGFRLRTLHYYPARYRSRFCNLNRPFHGLGVHYGYVIPPMNRWAIVIRPLRGLKYPWQKQQFLMLIEGFSIAGYRSFGTQLQKIGPCAQVNLLVGQNNSGKSNVLLFLKEHYANAIGSIANKKKGLSFSAVDRHVGGPSTNFRFALPLPSETEMDSLQRLSPNTRKNMAVPVLNAQVLREGDGTRWVVFAELNQGGPLRVDEELIEALKDVIPANYWQTLWSSLSGQTGGSIVAVWIPQTLLEFAEPVLMAPKVSLIPAIRRIDTGNAGEDDHSGIGLVDRLAILQNPPLDQQESKKRFQNINEFLRSVIGNRSARLEVPYSRDMILVHMDGKTLPLSSLGTGIHEVTILAAAATALTDQVICIEEPELHLHPLLQKKLVRYLQEKTDNQYFFTTHSAHLLDTPNAAIFHVRYQQGATTIERVETAASKSAVCVDLGYRASDLVQSNCVIWVEGPSDRLYLNRWIKTVDDNLIEGVHYSIMIYGGRLLSHLSALDPEITDFISLRRLNRYIAIVIDSDRPTAHSPINATKRRVRDEFNQGPGFAWVTKGREIENYLTSEIVVRSLKGVYRDVKKLVSDNQFAHALHYKNSTNRIIQKIDKVKVAHEVMKEPVDLSVLDLKRMIEKTVAFIRQANDIN